jgi:hypothetical protein
MKGRKPVPTYLKEIRNTRRKDRVPKHEPRPGGDLLEASEWLATERQRGSWTWHIANSPAGLLKWLERAMVAAFCVAASTLAGAVEELAAAGSTLVPGSVAGMLVQHPSIGSATRTCAA